MKPSDRGAQLIIICDMEGASGIFEHNAKAMYHGTQEWRNEGKQCITSDVLAICEAANEMGVSEILIYDGHYAGNPESNLLLEKLPSNARLFDTPDRCFYWRRIRGQASMEPLGVITVGQHARYGEPHAYFPHTIQSPPIKEVLINGIHIAEIGQAVLNFEGTKYIANIGCQASMKEARELSDTVHLIPIKDKQISWEPSPEETYPIIKNKVKEALQDIDHIGKVELQGPYQFLMALMEGFEFEQSEKISWKGKMKPNEALWEAPDVAIGLEIFNYIREKIYRKG